MCMEELELSQLIFLGLIMSVGFVAGSLGERLGLPRVAAYVIVGVIFSHDLLGYLLPASRGVWSEALTDVALGIIAFLVGAELELGWLRERGKCIVLGVLGQSISTVLIVWAGMWAFSHLSDSVALDAGSAMVIAAISSATAPAAVIAVIDEYKARGPLTSTLLSIVAIDDALAIVYFTLAMSFVAGGGQVNPYMSAGWEIIGSLVVGMILGWILGLLGKKIHLDDFRLPVVIGFILLTLGIASTNGFSLLLSCMTLGFVSKIIAGDKTERWLMPMNHIRETIFVIFFTLAGAHFQVDVFIGSSLLIATYIALRTIGKVSGAYAGTKIGGAPPQVYKYSGLGLLSQAGVAIGLALIATSEDHLGQTGPVLLNMILGSTMFFELTAPIITKKVLEKAGETHAA